MKVTDLTAVVSATVFLVKLLRVVWYREEICDLQEEVRQLEHTVPIVELNY